MIKLLRRPGLPSRRFSPEPPPRSNCPAGYAPTTSAGCSCSTARQPCPLVLDGRLRQPRKGTSPLRFCAFAIPAATISSWRWIAMPLRTIDGRGPPQRRPAAVQVKADDDRRSGGECGPGLRSRTPRPAMGPATVCGPFRRWQRREVWAGLLALPGANQRARSHRVDGERRLTDSPACRRACQVGQAQREPPWPKRASHEASRGVRWSVRSNPLPDGRLMRPGDIDHRGQKPTDVILPPEIRLVRLAAGSP
ncbi:hypothetical protein QFZ22_006727 [Streptomyces canus]|uniref:Uncharacterized protein n=1 Tax=Streptomyces canus TaxID=58343 RepID=A0AAW8FKS5_9ACTN|nr:hypothetical protein [Streptomyces canus]